MVSPLIFVCLLIFVQHDVQGFFSIPAFSYCFGERRPPDVLRGPLAVPYGFPTDVRLFPLGFLHCLTVLGSVALLIFLGVPLSVPCGFPTDCRRVSYTCPA
jgi:hypothetical protein